MVRGTNKLIIEINDMENRFFEKAILYVRENAEVDADKSLEEHANQYIATMQKDNKISFFRLAVFKKMVQLTLACLLGCFITLFIIGLF